MRFNQDRKFHELNYVNFELFSQGKEIDKKFKGLKWVTPEFKNNSKEEIILINEAKSYLKNDNRNKMEQYKKLVCRFILCRSYF